PPERHRVSARSVPAASRQTPEYQVPVSPVRKRTPPPQTSPARVMLGIDKGLRAQDVSLKRSPHRAKLSANSYNLARITQSGSLGRQSHVSSAVSTQKKSFNERIAE